MTRLKKIAAAVALSMGAASAGAATITNLDGSFDFGGFDWASNGSIWVQDYDILAGSNVAGDTDLFTLTYMANAVAIQDASGTNYTSATMPGLNTSYEYTIFATVQERATCLTANCSLAQIDVLGGTWNVYYDVSPEFNAITGVGVTDGTNILTGSFSPSPDSQSVVAPQGTSNPGDVALLAALQGLTTFTNTDFIVPELDTTTAVTTIQFGDFTTSWTRPTSFDGVPTGADTNTSFVGQADANQDFEIQDVPEPGSLALVGLGLGLAGFAARRRRQA